MGDLTLFLPEAVVLLGALLTFVGSVTGVRPRTNHAVGIVAAIAAVAVTWTHMGSVGEPFFAGIYRVDAFSQPLKLGVVVGLLLTLLAASRPMGAEGSVLPHARVETPVFLYFSALGMMLLVSATEMLTLYVALELSAYGLYILAAISRMQRRGSEGAAKYILFGTASSAITLYGLSLIYGATTTTYLDQIVQADPTPLMLVGVLLALAGVLFKLAVFPFHAWAPDTYEAAPHEAVTFIGTASKVVAVGIIARIALLAMPEHAGIASVLVALCVLSMTVGNLAAMAQSDLKRLLAYSTVAHAGYILIGLAAFTELGVASAITYGLVYVPIAFCAFLVVAVLGADGSNPSKASLAGLYQRSPMLAFTLLVAMFGLAGIPPTVGFAGKWFLFSAAIDADMLWLVIVGAVNATISLYYYLGVVKEAYLTPPAEGAEPITMTPAATIGAWLAIALVTLLGFWPRPVWEMAEAAAAAVVGR